MDREKPGFEALRCRAAIRGPIDLLQMLLVTLSINSLDEIFATGRLILNDSKTPIPGAFTLPHPPRH